MKINEKKLVEFLENHIGHNYKMLELLKDSGACEEDDGEKMENDKIEIDLVIDDHVCQIAEKNGFRFNRHHHDNHLWGMPWVYDFYIEVADIEKDIARINSEKRLRSRKAMIEYEYGNYDEYRECYFGFRPTTPTKILELYDQICEEIEGPEYRD